MITLRTQSLLILALAASAGAATLPPGESSKSLQTTVAADRETYFTGEAAVFTVTVRNTRPTAVEVPEPLAGGNGCFALKKRDERGSLAPVVAHPICPTRSAGDETPATTVLNSGEQRQSSVSADALTFGLNDASALNTPGHYQLEYLYNNTRSTVGFQVVAPHLDAGAVTKLRDVSYTDPDSGKAVHLSAYLHAFALRWNDQSYICVSEGPGADGNALVADHNGDYAGGDFPYVRIAATPDPVISIIVTTDAQNRLIVSWQDDRRVWRSRVLLAYPLDPARAMSQVRSDSTAEALNAAQNRQTAPEIARVSSAASK
jgi:hypothetical protein